MELLIYFGVLLAVATALTSMSYVWLCALRDALSARGAGRHWPLLIVALGWLGALLYWNSTASRAYSRTLVQ